MEQIERVARAICAADNVDPDMEVCGMGVQLAVGVLAPAWHARRWQAMAAIEAYDPPQVAKALRGELGRPSGLGMPPIKREGERDPDIDPAKREEY